MICLKRVGVRLIRMWGLWMKTNIEARLPRALLEEAKELIREGWVRDMDELLAEALRRYLESHSSKLTETYIRQDVEWGLHGQD